MTRWSTAIDVGIVLVLGVATLAIGRDPTNVEVATLLLVVLPLLVRRNWPLAVLVVVALGAVVTAPDADEPWVQVAAVALASFTYGERSTDRTWSALSIITVAALTSLALMAQGAEPVEALVLTFVIVMPA